MNNLKCAICGLTYNPSKPKPCGSEDGPSGPEPRETWTPELLKFMRCVLGTAKPASPKKKPRTRRTKKR